MTALYARCKTKIPPIEELKKACLADGYPPDKVRNMSYPTFDRTAEEYLGKVHHVTQTDADDEDDKDPDAHDDCVDERDISDVVPDDTDDTGYIDNVGDEYDDPRDNM